jgi:hypothetical protein
MTKSTKELTKREEQDLAINEELEAKLERMAQEDAGQGVSNRSEDKFYPLMTVLQPLSPQVDENHQAYVNGAKAGAIWLRNFETPIVKGTEGIVVQPIMMYEEFVEWVPRERGGGMVSRSFKRHANARCVDKATNRWKIGENELRETRMWVVIVWVDNAPVPFIIPCQGTQNTFARQWNTIIGQQFNANGTVTPAWGNLWRLTTKQRTNSKGTWYVFTFEHEQKVRDTPTYMAGRQLHAVVKEAVEQGRALSEVAEQEEGTTDEGAM